MKHGGKSIKRTLASILLVVVQLSSAEDTEFASSEPVSAGRLELREPSSFGPALVTGREVRGEPDGSAVTAWDTTVLTEGWQSATVDGVETTLELIVGQPYGTLPDPGATPEGYSFGGWFTGPNGTGRQITSDSLVKAGDAGLCQHWKKDESPPVKQVVTNTITYVWSTAFVVRKRVQPSVLKSNEWTARNMV